MSGPATRVTVSAHAAPRDILRQVPKSVALFDAAVAALSATLLPARLIPDNLDVIGPVVSLLVLLGLFVTIRYADVFRRHVFALTSVSAVALMGLLAIQLTLVCGVPGLGDPGATPRFLVGWQLTGNGLASSAALGARTCVDLIAGAGASRIPAMWGTSYFAAALLYALTYVGFVVGAVLAFGGAMSRGRTDRGVG